MQPTPDAPWSAAPRDAFALVADAHDDLRRRIDALVVPSWRAPPSRQAMLDAGLCLNVHAALVHALVYPAVRAGAGDAGSLARAEAGLDEVLATLEGVLATDESDDRLAERLATLRRQAERQFADEEVALFVQLASGDLDVDELGRRLVAQRQALLEDLGMRELPH